MNRTLVEVMGVLRNLKKSVSGFTLTISRRSCIIRNLCLSISIFVVDVKYLFFLIRNSLNHWTGQVSVDYDCLTEILDLTDWGSSHEKPWPDGNFNNDAQKVENGGFSVTFIITCNYIWQTSQKIILYEHSIFLHLIRVKCLLLHFRSLRLVDSNMNVNYRIGPDV